VPRLLSDDQKTLCVSVCRELKQAIDDPIFISNIITGDETNSPRPKKASQVRSNVKSMLIFFFDIQGIVHKEFAPPGQTVNGKFYYEFLKRLREDIRRKHPDKWKKNNWFLHDNAPAKTSLVVRQFLTSKNIVVIPPPPRPIRQTSPLATFFYSPR
jgi:hypothetical protein